MLGFRFAGPMLRLLRNSSRAQDWSAPSRLLARTFVVEPRRLLEIDRNGPLPGTLRILVVSFCSCAAFGLGIDVFSWFTSAPVLHLVGIDDVVVSWPFHLL